MITLAIPSLPIIEVGKNRHVGYRDLSCRAILLLTISPHKHNVTSTRLYPGSLAPVVRLNRPLGSSGPHAKESNHEIQNITLRYNSNFYRAAKALVLCAFRSQFGNLPMSPLWTFGEDRPSMRARATCCEAILKDWWPAVFARCC